MEQVDRCALIFTRQRYTTCTTRAGSGPHFWTVAAAAAANSGISVSALNLPVRHAWITRCRRHSRLCLCAVYSTPVVLRARVSPCSVPAENETQRIINPLMPTVAVRVYSYKAYKDTLTLRAERQSAQMSKIWQIHNYSSAVLKQRYFSRRFACSQWRRSVVKIGGPNSFFETCFSPSFTIPSSSPPLP